MPSRLSLRLLHFRNEIDIAMRPEPANERHKANEAAKHEPPHVEYRSGKPDAGSNGYPERPYRRTGKDVAMIRACLERAGHQRFASVGTQSDDERNLVRRPFP